MHLIACSPSLKEVREGPPGYSQEAGTEAEVVLLTGLLGLTPSTAKDHPTPSLIKNMPYGIAYRFFSWRQAFS